MNVYVFVGPSLYLDAATQELDAVYLPPAERGDLDSLKSEGPNAVGILDGASETHATLQPREVLRAISRGNIVFGGGGLGAVLAALLDGSGMVGIGEIFEAYRDRHLTDSGEVAVCHGPPETGFLPLSDALVDIRWTFERAETAAIISAATAEALMAIATGLPLCQRSYARVLRHGVEHDLPGEEMAALRDWLPGRRIDQKRRDATSVLRAMKSQIGDLAAGARPISAIAVGAVGSPCPPRAVSVA